MALDIPSRSVVAKVPN